MQRKWPISCLESFWSRSCWDMPSLSRKFVMRRWWRRHAVLHILPNDVWGPKFLGCHYLWLVVMWLSETPYFRASKIKRGQQLDRIRKYSSLSFVTSYSAESMLVRWVWFPPNLLLNWPHFPKKKLETKCYHLESGSTYIRNLTVFPLPPNFHNLITNWRFKNLGHVVLWNQITTLSQPQTTSSQRHRMLLSL